MRLQSGRTGGLLLPPKRRHLPKAGTCVAGGSLWPYSEMPLGLAEIGCQGAFAACATGGEELQKALQK